MRALQPRELRLAVITALVAVIGFSVVFLRARIELMRHLSGQRLSMEVQSRQQDRLLESQPVLIQELERIRGQLPRHPEGRNLQPEFARQVQALASHSGLRLTGLTPENEIHLEEIDLYQSSLRASWSGTSEQLIAFLHRLHQLGAVADIREIRLRNRSGHSDGLSGTFTIDFVYTRVENEDSAQPAPSGQESSAEDIL